MEALPSGTEGRPLPAWSISSHERRPFQPPENSTLLPLTELLEVSDDDLELIEMRYRQMLALMNLEALFAEGQLDCCGAA